MRQHSLRNCGDAARFLEREGWVVVGDVFDEEEVLELRARIRRSVDDGHDAGDLLSNPHLADFLSDERIVAAAKGLLPAKPVYFGDSSLQCAAPPRTMMFHKDNPDKFRPDYPDWQSPYTLIRIAVYLQDCASYSGGLAVRRRSHTVADSRVGTALAVPSRAGDLVAFKLTTTHAGFATRLRFVPRFGLPMSVQRRLATRSGSYDPSSWLVRPMQRTPRMALFSTFAIEDAHLTRYLEYFRSRPYAVRRGRQSSITAGAASRLCGLGVTFIDLQDEMRRIDLDGLSEEHVDLPPPTAGTHAPVVISSVAATRRTSLRQ